MLLFGEGDEEEHDEDEEIFLLFGDTEAEAEEGGWSCSLKYSFPPLLKYYSPTAYMVCLFAGEEPAEDGRVGDKNANQGLNVPPGRDLNIGSN